LPLPQSAPVKAQSANTLVSHIWREWVGGPASLSTAIVAATAPRNVLRCMAYFPFIDT
jgi:hypothetical protein